MKLNRMQKIGVLGSFCFLLAIGFLVSEIIFDRHPIDAKIIYGLSVSVFGLLLGINFAVPYIVDIQINDEKICLYRKHFRQIRACVRYEEILKAYFGYQGGDIAFIYKKDGRRIFVTIDYRWTRKYDNLKEKLTEKVTEKEYATNITYKGHDVEFNKKVNKIRKGCDGVIDL